MNKKFLIAIILILAVVLVAGFFAYKYLGQVNSADTENLPVQIEAGGTQPDGGGLSICFDKCGDNVCQKTDPNCKDNSMNCICLETSQECPQDCK
ncbi:MAG: hypothetical protein AAB925_01205 [Patescibacteria group bacterium]